MPTNSDYDAILGTVSLGSDTTGDGNKDRRRSDVDYVAVPPGIPGGYKAEVITVCDQATSVATARTFLTKASVGSTLACSGGGGSHQHDYYDPCCEPMYTSLGFTSDANGLSLEWSCLEWDGTKYQGLNTSLGNPGPYSLEVYFDECGRGWTAVIEPLNTQSILGQLSGTNIEDTEAAVGSYTYTGGGPVLWSDAESGITVADHKADDLDGCGDDLLDPSIYPTSATELINVSGSVTILECEEPETPCACDYALNSPIQLILYPDEMDSGSSLDLGYYEYNTSASPVCSFTPATNHANPGVTGVEVVYEYDGDGMSEYWMVKDNSTHVVPDGWGGTHTVTGHIEASAYDNGSNNGAGWMYNSTEVYSSKVTCSSDPTQWPSHNGFTFYSVDGSGNDAQVDALNNGCHNTSSCNRAKIEVVYP
tara:strand:- start:13914 stop:15179 length:1266 start_codon:yes stop_codon:yes gene_type:complete